MSWAASSWLWWLVAVLALAGVLAGMGRYHRARLSTLFHGELLDRVWPRAVRTRRVVRDIALLLGLAGLVLALAEPRFGKRLQEVEAEGIDLVLVVDLSRSMDARDVDPSRLERARREILDLVEILEGDRVGLVIYAGGAFPRMPLTLDYKALRLLVRELDTSTFQAQGSSLDEAIRVGVQLLDNDNDAGRAMFVLTDGGVHLPEDALSVAEEAPQAGVAIFGLVIGSEAAPIPNPDGTSLVDPASGARVMSAPDTAVLSDCARITGGAVVQSVASNTDITRLYRDEIRGRLRTTVGRSSRRETWTSAFQYPLGAGVTLLLFASWLGDGRKIATLMVMLLAVGLPDTAQAQTARDGDALYRQGRYDEAADLFTELTLLDPDDSEIYERLGAARYRAGDYDGAARAFARQSELDPDADVSFNEGNAYYMAGKLDQAMESYEETLQRQGDHPGATHNLQMVTQEIQQRRMQQQQQQQQGEGEGEPKEGEQQEGEQQEGQQGEPQEGQQGQQGEPSESEQDAAASAESEPEDGEPSESEPSGDEGADPKAGQEEPEEGDGTREEEGEDGQASLDELEDGEQGEPTEDEGGSGGSPGSEEAPPDGEMTEEQADRVLDGVEEGRPHVYVPGRNGEKPW